MIESDPAEYQDGPEPNPLVAPVEAVPDVEEKEQEEVADPEDDEWVACIWILPKFKTIYEAVYF